MKPLHILKPGHYITGAGDRVTFSENDLHVCANAYDPALHEAPIVIGHPTTNAPAYGWIKRLSAQGRDLIAEPQQLEPTFAESVVSGRYKKLSAAFYAPDSPHNPVPGIYYLQHVGFLGAQPPAVKGLKPVTFSEGEEGVVVSNEDMQCDHDPLSGKEQALTFSEGSKTQPLVDAVKSLFTSATPLVDFSQRAVPGRCNTPQNSLTFSERASDPDTLHQQAMALKARESIPYEAAVKRCLTGESYV